MAPQVRLGLIGDNIRASRSPALHRHCGAMTGLDVSYDLYVPLDLGRSFEDILRSMPSIGIAGANVTLPYKERAGHLVRIDDPNIARIGAVNTVRFGPEGLEGFNTDYSGFSAAWRAAWDDMRPGRVALIGGGGVGKAIAFALVTLGADEVIIIDINDDRAGALAHAVTEAGRGQTHGIVGRPDILRGVDGIVNGTPLGMHGYPGSPLQDGQFPKCSWAFDAVYTPAETPFRDQALAAGARFLSGWELFFHQGIDAFEIFTCRRPNDLGELRARILAGPGSLDGASRGSLLEPTGGP